VRVAEFLSIAPRAKYVDPLYELHDSRAREPSRPFPVGD
jgi:hypothetical protein